MDIALFALFALFFLLVKDRVGFFIIFVGWSFSYEGYKPVVLNSTFISIFHFVFTISTINPVKILEESAHIFSAYNTILAIKYSQDQTQSVLEIS